MTHLQENHEALPHHSGSDNLYEAGINVGKDGFYNPSEGSSRPKNEKPTPEATPLLATDPGQPESVGDAKVISRDRNKVLDKSEQVVLDSKSKATGRKAKTTEE